MIMTRTPLRISIGGGGTDLPSYYRQYGGLVISAAITKYVYLTVNRSFLPGYFLRYSENEHRLSSDSISHPLFRGAIEMQGVQNPVEIVSIADVPAGTGLGSSGSFLVGLIHALHAYKREPVTADRLAREAVEVEMERLEEPVGKQDHYIAAYGGLLCQCYHCDDTVTLNPLKMNEAEIRELRDSLMLFFIGRTRQASSLLRDQKKRTEEADAAMLDGLHFTKQLGTEIQATLESGRIGEFGPLMHQHWQRKRCRSKGMSNDQIDEIYEMGRAKGGASGGKLVGAGGSGFLLFQATDRKRLRDCMNEAGLAEMEFNFDFDGSVVHTRSA
jgi:D-glycero-alpha-D-manno-heptose-7-phosphate kinase